MSVAPASDDDDDRPLALGADPAEAAAELARRWMTDAPPGPADLPQRSAPRLALGWALKSLCYAAWNSEPRQAGAAALALAQLRDAPWPAAAEAAPFELPPRAAAQQELASLAAWTEGIARLTTGQPREAVQCLDQAEQGFAALDQPGHAAQTQVPKLLALSLLGQPKEALACGERALAAFQAQGDHRAAGRVSLNLANVSLRLDDPAAAAQRFRAAAVLLARAGDHEQSVLADVGLANALDEQGDFNEALRIYARARMRAQRHALPLVLAMVDESEALIHMARGRYREALAGLEGARRSYQQHGLPQQLAIAEKQLADAYLELHLLPEALDLYQQVLARLASLQMQDDPDHARALAQCGRTLAWLGRADEARQALDQAAARFRQQGSPLGAAQVLLARAELAQDQGQADEAEHWAEQALQAWAGAPATPASLRARVLRAEVLLAQGRLQQAEAALAEGLAQARQLQALGLQARCLAGLGQLARCRGHGAQARRYLLAAVTLLEDQRRALPGDELRNAFQGWHQQPYQALLALALVDWQDHPGPAQAMAVLQAMERMRARALVEHLATPPALPDTECVDDGTRALRERVQWLARRCAAGDDGSLPPAEWLNELRSAERALLERARRTRLAGRGPEQSRQVPGAGQADELDTDLDDDQALRSLQAGLQPDQALVAYAVVQPDPMAAAETAAETAAPAPRLVACVLTNAGVQVVQDFAPWSQVLQACQALHFQLDALRHGQAPVQVHLGVLAQRARQRLAQLHALLWAPLQPHLARVRRVLLVLPAPLATMPFAALQADAQAESQPLGLQLELACVPSAALALRGLQRPLLRGPRALALGESGRLPHAAEEAQFVAGLFPQGQAAVGPHARVQAVLDQAPRLDVLHLACHAQFRADNPLFSALHLADGLLTAEQVQQELRLGPALVVLSGCDTGLATGGAATGTAAAPDAIGLVRAFLAAGAARVLASLWPVDDEVTRRFMADFHAALQAGAGPAHALQQAQAHARRQHAHPAQWAGFVLHGGH